jgi:hypothetical protein
MFALHKTTHHSTDHPMDADRAACMFAVVCNNGGRATNIGKAGGA